MSDKIYIWNGKQSKFGVRLSFSRKDLETMQANLSEKWYINFNLNERKEVGKFGETHSMTIDTWTPTPKASEGHNKPHDSSTNILDVPF
jgi:hypothetical protein